MPATLPLGIGAEARATLFGVGSGGGRREAGGREPDARSAPASCRRASRAKGLTGGVARMPRDMKSDIEIAQEARLRPIEEIARDAGIHPDDFIPYGRDKAKISITRHRPRRGAARGPAGARLRHHADAGGRGQVDDDGGPRAGAQPPGQESDHRAARAFPRALLRHEGRRGRRRVLAGRAHGGHQPPLHRRLPGHHRGAQPARRDDRQPSPSRQRSRDRSARHSVPPRARHERPRAARQRSSVSAARSTASPARPASTSPWPRRSWRSSVSPAT